MPSDRPAGAASPPFRFIASMPGMGRDTEAWLDRVRRVEDLGYDAISISDHLVGGWSMDVFVSLAAAATATSRIRLLTLVLANDYRHPALVHRAIAALDVLSGGRAELGLGTGWIAHEYEALGITFDDGPTRVDRLEEAIQVIRGLYGEAPLEFEGRHYRIRGLAGSPRPVQEAGPPILVGGTVRRILELAGRRADIAGILPPRGAAGLVDAGDLSIAATAARLAYVDAGARDAGRDPAAVRRQLSLVAWRLPGADGSTVSGWASIGHDGLLETGREGDLAGVLVGSLDGAADQLDRWRRELGITDIHVGSDAATFAPLVARMAGR